MSPKTVSQNLFDARPYRIWEGKFWNVLVSPKQAYLGRCAVYLKSRLLENPLQLTKAERAELWEDILPRMEQALQKTFHPDRINYAHHANAVHQVHWHIIPRYEKNSVRRFDHRIFRDTKVGHNYAGRKSRKLSEKVMQDLANVLQAALQETKPTRR